MVDTIKFSEFASGGDLDNGSTTVGLSGGSNASFNNPWTFLPSGTTAERPAIAADMYFRLRFNTDLVTYEYYDSVSASWIQIDDSADVANLIARLAAYIPGDGASMIGLENQGLITDKTVQDLAEASFIAQSSNGTLVNAQFLDALATGFLSSTTATGVVASRVLTGTANEVDVANGDGSGNPTLSLSATADAPGTFTVQGTTAVNAIINDNSMATATAANLATATSIKTYVDSVAGGGFTVILSCLLGTTANLTGAYANGAAGVGATLTNNSTQVALSIDGVLTQVADRILVKNQTSTPDNGVYTVTTVGTGASNWVLTRATDYDEAAEIVAGTLVPVSDGTINGGSIYLQSATVTTVGTDPVIFDIYAQPGSTFVTLATTQTISGAKTFSNNVALSGGSTLDLNGSTAVDGVIDDDTLATASATSLATSESIKAYVDSLGGGSNPIGSVASFALTSAPTGYLVCDGAAISRATYIDLFTAIGTTWGVGDGSTTFNIPDMQRKTGVGSGGSATGTLGNAVGDTGGAEDITLTTAQMPAHTHNWGGVQSQGTTSGNSIFATSGSAATTTSTGGGGSHSNIQPSTVLLICIKSSADSSIASGGNVGDFVDFGGTSAPAGCLVRDGSAVSRTTYASLFSVISTTYGIGDGATTFNLPDSQRKVSVGSGGVGTAELGNSVGDTGGAETVTLTTAEIPAHIHPNVIAGVGGSDSLVAGSGTAVGGNTGSTGGGGAHNNMQPSIVILPCIRYEGVSATVAVTASQAQMEAAASSAVFSAPAVQQFHPGHPKGWVLYNQLTGPSIAASYNVTSVTDSALGIFIVNWTTPFSSASYSTSATTSSAGGGNNLIGIGASGKAAGTATFTTIQLTSQIDRDGNSVIACGDQA